ncbi:hypothetical protein GF420_12885 [candidate division GN15 bacterium]|nr:hypothetical protein [candidate division GN15 bacterium]
MTDDVQHLPPNLAKLGLPRKGADLHADLETIWLTPYMVLTPYVDCCDDLGIAPFAGGSYLRQGTIAPGFITSGYRDNIIEGNDRSAHLHALALDIHVGSIEKQIAWARVFAGRFMRVGLYPDDTFIHVDQMPLQWIERYAKTRYWVGRAEGTGHKYTGFNTLADAIAAAA